MNKKQKRQELRKQKQKRRNTMILLAIGGAMMVLAAFLFARQGGDDGGGMPAIAVDQQKIDYGDVKFGVNKTFAIKVTNTGDGTLRFKEMPYVQVLEGC
jgi:hypothetical protein